MARKRDSGNDIEMKVQAERNKGQVNLAFEGDGTNENNGRNKKPATNGISKHKPPKIILMTDDDLYGRIADINRDVKETKFDIHKNLFVLSFSFTVLFTAFLSLTNLESSVNSTEGLGTISLSLIYVVLVVCSVGVPSAVINWLGLKRTMVVCILLFCPYFAANVYPRWYTLLPASVLVGGAAAPLWTANCGYITELARNYESVIGESIGTVLLRFFGIFFMVFQTSQIWGNLISYGVFDKPGDERLGQEPGLSTNELNSSTWRGVSRNCGLKFSNLLTSGEKGQSHEPVSEISSEMLQLCTIFSACCLISAALLAVWLDPLEKNSDERSLQRSESVFSLKLLKESVQHVKNPLQMALIPLTVFSGLEQAFIFGDFTISFVTCYWGVAYVGCVMIVFGVVNALFSIIAGGPLTRMAGRAVTISSGVFFTGTSMVIMFFWQMIEDRWESFSDGRLILLVAGLWGAGDAVWKTQISGLYGDLFPDKRNVAYSSYRLWESLGFAVAFAYSGYLRTDCKLFIVLFFLIVGFLGYAVVEIKVRAARNPSTREDITTDNSTKSSGSQ